MDEFSSFLWLTDRAQLIHRGEGRLPKSEAMQFLFDMTTHTCQMPSILFVHPKVYLHEDNSFESRLFLGKLNGIDVGIRIPILTMIEENELPEWHYCLVCLRNTFGSI